MSTSAEIVVGASSGPTWSERHARGEVPGAWPYGLDQLGRPGVDVGLKTVAEPTRRERMQSLVPRRAHSTGAVGLAWDEVTAHRMLVSGRYAEQHCGVIWATDQIGDLGPRRRFALRRTLSAMSSVWVLSRGQLDALDRLLPAGTARDVVLFGVDEDFFFPTPPPERPLVFSAGGDRDRDHATLVEAFKRVVAARPEVEAVLQTRHEVPDAGPVKVVAHLTHRQLREHYQRASVVAIATRPNLHVSGMTVSLEAQASGRPVVLTGTPGADDYVVEGKTGFLVGSGRADEIAERLVHLVDDPGSAHALGQQARTRVEDGFTSRHLADRLGAAVGLW